MMENNGAERAPQQNGSQEKNGAPPETQAQQAGPAAPQAELEKQVEQLKTELKDKEAKYLYLYAEFENFKKRAFKERDDARKFGWEGAALELLQVVDNLERATAHMAPTVDKNLAQGIQMVLSQFRSALQKSGVEVIETAKKPFDPDFHEAVAQEPSQEPEGTILSEHQKGYTLHSRLLRPARVVVSGGQQGSAKA